MSGKIMLFALVALSLALVGGCGGSSPKTETPKDMPSPVTITQGVWGNVRFWKGDFMPSIPPGSGTITPVVREVLIFEPTKHKACTVAKDKGGGFFEQVPTKRVATTTSDATGFFQVSLPAGKYSLLVKERALYYANSEDGDGFLHPVTVASGSVTETPVDIDYEALW